MKLTTALKTGPASYFETMWFSLSGEEIKKAYSKTNFNKKLILLDSAAETESHNKWMQPLVLTPSEYLKNYDNKFYSNDRDFIYKEEMI